MRAKDFFKGKNFMTPHVLSYGWIKENEIAYELSKGEGFYHDVIYGVSVRGVDKKSECFDTLLKAQTYIEKLRKDLKAS